MNTTNTNPDVFDLSEEPKGFKRTAPSTSGIMMSVFEVDRSVDRLFLAMEELGHRLDPVLLPRSDDEGPVLSPVEPERVSDLREQVSMLGRRVERAVQIITALIDYHIDL